jgi:hypothetical protein
LVRGVEQRVGLIEARPHDIRTHHVDDSGRVRRRLHPFEIEGLDPVDLHKDVVELHADSRELLVGESEPRELRDVADLLLRDGHEADASFRGDRRIRACGEANDAMIPERGRAVG